jgi:membrane-bound serine protease (ClpP class)
MDNPLTLALILIVLGLVLLIAEVFLPSGGVLFVASVVLIVGGIAVVFYFGDTYTGFLTLLGVFVVTPIVAGLAFHIWRKSPLSRQLILQGAEEDDATVATMPVNLELEQLRGRFGRAVSPLRPSGVVDFDGRRIDALTEGIMVEPGTWVRCIDVRAGHVLVRPMDPPQLNDLENLKIT